MVDTGIWRNVSTVLKPGLYLWNKAFFKTPAEGALTTIYLASSEEVNGVTGKYFKLCKEAQPKSHVTDPERCLKLWEESAKIVHLTSDDPKI